MPSPTFSLDPALVRAWPGLCLGCLVYDVCVRESTPDSPVWTSYRESVAPSLSARLATTELSAMPGIGEARRAFKAFGADPGRWRVSSEALYRRVRQGKDLYRINTLVDTNNLVSLETGLSLGSYDADRTGQAILLRKGLEGETYDGIGKGGVPLTNIPVLCDGDGPFGSPVSDSTRALITTATTRAFTVLYGFAGTSALQEALELAQERLVRLANVTALTVLPILS